MRPAVTHQLRPGESAFTESAAARVKGMSPERTNFSVARSFRVVLLVEVVLFLLALVVLLALLSVYTRASGS